MDAVQFAKEWGPLVTALVAFSGAGLAWAKQWADSRSQHSKDRIDLVRIAEEVSAAAIRRLSEENAELRKRFDDLEEEFASFRRTHDSMIADKDAELALLRGQVRQWQALALSYEKKLTEAGIPHEKPAQPFWGIDAGQGPTELIEGRLP